MVGGKERMVKKEMRCVVGRKELRKEEEGISYKPEEIKTVRSKKEDRREGGVEEGGVEEGGREKIAK